jgi:hypothetical protein
VEKEESNTQKKERKKEMKGKQCVNELKSTLNIVTSSLFDGRNIKYPLAFTVCNALPSYCAAYEQKT